MAGVSMRIPDAAFLAGGPFYGVPKHKARFMFQASMESWPHIQHKVWFKRRDGYTTALIGHSISVHGTCASWFETSKEFNLLPYQEIRAHLANAVEDGILEILDSTGAVATVTAIRQGTVA